MATRTKPMQEANLATPATYSPEAARSIGEQFASTSDSLSGFAKTIRSWPGFSDFGSPDYNFDSKDAKDMEANIRLGFTQVWLRKHPAKFFLPIVPAGGTMPDGFKALSDEDYSGLSDDQKGRVIAFGGEIALAISRHDFGRLDKTPAATGGAGLCGPAYKQMVHKLRKAESDYASQCWKRLVGYAAELAGKKRTRTVEASEFEEWLFGVTGDPKKPGILTTIQTRAKTAKEKRSDQTADIAKVGRAIEAFRKAWAE